MRQFLVTGVRRTASPVLTAALVVAGVTGLVLGPRVAPAPTGAGPGVVVVSGGDAGVQAGR